MKEKSKSICHHDNCYYYSSVTLFVLYYYIMTVSIPRQEKRKFTKNTIERKSLEMLFYPPFILVIFRYRQEIKVTLLCFLFIRLNLLFF